MKTIFDKKTNLVISVEDDFIENKFFGTTELLCVDNFILTKFNPNTNEFYESATKEEINEFNAKFNNELDIKYTKLISDLVDKHVQKLATRQIPIPKEILEEQQRLINEYKQLIR